MVASREWSLTELKRLKDSGDSLPVRVGRAKESISIIDGLRGEIEFHKDEIGESIILDRNGEPTPLFASACDDILSGIDFIVREDRLLDRSGEESYIENLLGYKVSKYIHIPTITMGRDITIEGLFRDGFIPDAIINYIILKSYRSTTKDIFYLHEAISWLKLEDISLEREEFDIELLRYLNREHIKLMDNIELSRVFGFADVNIGKVIKLYLNYCSTLNELNSKLCQYLSLKILIIAGVKR